MALPKLVISRIDFDALKIIDALKISPDETVTALQDGRGAWPFSEIWGEHAPPLFNPKTVDLPMPASPRISSALISFEFSQTCLIPECAKRDSSRALSLPGLTRQSSL